ncbi:MAG: DNA replication/repair protein RecF [Clostridia bacterium]|nr:DNA replication/repair protein RecF [Clostridia bacterium]
MILKKLKLKNFRNIKNEELIPSEAVNIIYGENAQGKTNLLEAIWLFSGNKSFRGSKDQNLIKFDEDFAKIEIDFFEDERLQKASIVFSEKKTVKLNEVKLESVRKLNGKILAVCFSPNELSIIKGGPVNRRKYLDEAIIQISNTYGKYVSFYDNLIKQRNALLKDIKYHTDLFDMLEIWDEKIAKVGSVISYQRKEYIKDVADKVEEIYSDLSEGNEKASIEIKSDYFDISMTEEEIRKNFERELKRNLNYDVETGNTSIGPHRDDFDFIIDNKNAKDFGSQGQQRCGAISLKLGEAQLIYEKTKRKPMVLLDDVLSELDLSRQNYILTKIDKTQIFLTCCELTEELKKYASNIVKIEEGKICTSF